MSLIDTGSPTWKVPVSIESTASTVPSNNHVTGVACVAPATNEAIKTVAAMRRFFIWQTLMIEIFQRRKESTPCQGEVLLLLAAREPESSKTDAE